MKTSERETPATQIDVETAGPVEPETSSRPPDVVDLLTAPMATLTYAPESREAQALAAYAVDCAAGHEETTGVRKRRRRAADLLSFSRAIGAILGDLLVHSPRGGHGALVYRSTQANSFSGGPVAYRQFMAALEALVGLQWLEQITGFYNARKFEWGNGVVSGQGRASRFRATATLLKIASDHGITAGSTRDHFRQPPLDAVIVLKAKSGRVGRVKVKGDKLEVPATSEVRRLRGEVRRIDAFLRGVEIAGGSHQAFVRQFEHGDQRGFRWNKGGRLYSSGPSSYQTLKKADRLAMRLDGEPVVEIDIKASYLTILHGKLGIIPDFGPDPYEVDGVPREVVKGWLVATFGAEKPLQRWPRDQATEFEKRTGRQLGRDHPVRVMRERMLARYPLLALAGGPDFSWPDLMFTESEVIIKTMLMLMEDGTPSLPVHDSLLVPACVRQQAVDALQRSFKEVVGVEAIVEVTGDGWGDRDRPPLPAHP